jgi:hypothetical protein
LEAPFAVGADVTQALGGVFLTDDGLGERGGSRTLDIDNLVDDLDQILEIPTFVSADAIEVRLELGDGLEKGEAGPRRLCGRAQHGLASAWRIARLTSQSAIFEALQPEGVLETITMYERPSPSSHVT